MANWSNIGAQVKSILEATFDNVAATTIVYVSPAGSQYSLKAMVSVEPLRLHRESYAVTNAGISDLENIRFCFKTSDILSSIGLEALDPAGHFLYNGIRYDFSTKFPGHSKEFTPMIGAEDTLTLCYVRKAEELEHEIPVSSTGDKFKYGNW